MVSYLLCLGAGVVQDHRDVALPPELPQGTIVLRPSWQSFLGAVLPFPETEGLRIIGVPGCWATGTAPAPAAPHRSQHLAAAPGEEGKAEPGPRP